MTEVLVDQYGPDEFIKRIADPVWFQSLGTVLAFDWNASGLTTILTAALKEAIRYQEKDLGVFQDVWRYSLPWPKTGASVPTPFYTQGLLWSLM